MTVEEYKVYFLLMDPKELFRKYGGMDFKFECEEEKIAFEEVLETSKPQHLHIMYKLLTLDFRSTEFDI